MRNTKGNKTNTVSLEARERNRERLCVNMLERVLRFDE
jgi:hypothetical protein